MKKIIPLLIGVALVLAACQGQAASTQPATQVIPTETAAPTETTAPTSAYPTSSAPPGCTVVSPRPTPGPTEESLFPPVSEDDWVLGPRDARITLTEFSDFQ